MSANAKQEQSSGIAAAIARRLYNLMSNEVIPWTGRIMSQPTFIPRAGPWDALDLDGSERITRPQTGWPLMPWPYITGAVVGFMPMQDAFLLRNQIAAIPFGPGVLTPVSTPASETDSRFTKVTA